VVAADEECGRSRPIAVAAQELAALDQLATPLVGPPASPTAAAMAPAAAPSATAVPAGRDAAAAPAAPSASAAPSGAPGCGSCAAAPAGGGPALPWPPFGVVLLAAALARRCSVSRRR
jgi:MYXO-CTERM domain-containing protein